MTRHLRYLKYLVLHKWFVFVAGLKTHAPLLRLIVHDWTKFLPSEWAGYVSQFYGDRDRGKWLPALNHHLKHNPHHWQYHILVAGRGKKETALQMPEKLVREMVADWAGAGRGITGKWEVKEWYEANKHEMKLHPATQERVEEILRRTQFGKVS